MAVAVDQGHGFKPFARPPRCKLPSFTQLDYNMLDFSQSELTRSLEHAFECSNIHKSFSTPCFSHSNRVDNTSDTKSRVEIIVGHAAPRVQALVDEVATAMALGVNPEPTSSGLGGAYFLRSPNGDTIAVAKPIDEEPLAFNNPKGYAERMLGQPGMKHSIRIGETGLRESAAYLLDHAGFSGVPPTALVKFSDVKFNLNGPGSDSTPSYKIASLQRFVNHDSDSADLGPSSFSVCSVHHIGILDVRLMNLDRHAGNILVVQGQDSCAGGKAELVPIDHGFCLPESLDDPYFEWLHWPQASIPFSESEVDYIESLDPYKDAELLRTELPSLRESAIRVLVLCTIFLKQATSYGLCLADIGEMMTREFHGGEENWSALEKLCINAKANMNDGLSDGSSLSDLDGKVDEIFKFDDKPEDDSKKVSEFLCADDLSNGLSDDNVTSDTEEEVDKNFQFDDEHDDDLEKISDVPHILWNSSKLKPSEVPSFSFMSELDGSKTFTLHKNERYQVDDGDWNTNLDSCACGENDGDDNPKAGALMRSLSFHVPNYTSDCQGISFGEMNDGEWLLFLESFEKLLPEAFEERKSMGLSKQRLGSSCEF